MEVLKESQLKSSFSFKVFLMMHFNWFGVFKPASLLLVWIPLFKMSTSQSHRDIFIPHPALKIYCILHPTSNLYPILHPTSILCPILHASKPVLDPHTWAHCDPSKHSIVIYPFCEYCTLFLLNSAMKTNVHITLLLLKFSDSLYCLRAHLLSFAEREGTYWTGALIRDRALISSSWKKHYCEKAPLMNEQELKL